MTPDQIKSLRELLAKATPGPWTAGVHVICTGDYIPDQEAGEIRYPDGKGSRYRPMTTANAQLIAEAVNALPELLDAAEELDRYKKALERALNGLAMNREVVERDVNHILAGKE